MGLRPAKFREKPAEANKYRTWGEEAAGFFDPVARIFQHAFTGPPALVPPAVYAAGSLHSGKQLQFSATEP
jgi:hypothetical protein